MPTFSHRAAVLFMAFIALLGWMALSLQLNLLISNGHKSGMSSGESISRFFGYFTILTNLLAALNLTVLLAFPMTALARQFARPSMQTAITMYLVIVSLGYNLLLRHLWQPTGVQFWIDELLHDVIPLLYLVYWLSFVLKGKLNFLHPLSWLIYPLLYLFFILMRGNLDGFYPYPFMNVVEVGYRQVVKHASFLSLAFLLAGYLFVVIDKMMFRRKQRTVIS
jgi:hypothetical protein